MIALDLFCGGGGTAEGLMQAGFEVVGIDHKDHSKNYPGRFILADALSPPMDLSSFDLVWASPPCQRFSVATLFKGKNWAESKPDLIEPTRKLLRDHPFTVIENVPRAPIRGDIILTGPAVGLDRIYRKRKFETSWYPGLIPQPISLPPGSFASGRAVTITTKMCSNNHFYPRKKIGLPGRVGNQEAREVMGIHHPMTNREIGESVPPAYAYLIAKSALRAMGK